MTSHQDDTPEYERHHGMILEEMRDMFRVISEQTKDIPQIKIDVAETKERITSLEDRMSAVIDAASAE